MLFGRKNKANNEPKEPQQMAVRWDSSREHREAMLNSSLFGVAAQLTQMAHPNGGTPEELVPTFTKTYGLLQDWFRGGPFKAELRQLLDTLYPDPVGYEPEENLVGTKKFMMDPWHAL